MHGLPTIHKKEQLAADNQEANRILEQYGTKSDNPLPSAPARADIVFIPYGTEMGVVYTNAKGDDFLSRHADTTSRLGPIRLVSHGDVGLLRELANVEGVTF